MIHLTPLQEAALREIFAWGQFYPLRPAEMAQLDGMGLVRRNYGMAWSTGTEHWDITEKGKEWVRSQDDYRPVRVTGSLG